MSGKWYVIHVYSGFENKVVQSIKEQAHQKHLDEMIEEVLVHDSSAAIHTLIRPSMVASWLGG